IMTRGHAYDEVVLKQVLQAKCTPRYVGMIGSLRKREQVYSNIRAAGIQNDRLANVYCPIGLGIKAESPTQIAVSVVAELLACKGKVLQHLRQ
ncbi:MAG: XdhC family protein, partial [Desulfovibrio sp.]|nr:XdhC family protein [Desulfovibrio sp.]